LHYGAFAQGPGTKWLRSASYSSTNSRWAGECVPLQHQSGAQHAATASKTPPRKTPTIQLSRNSENSDALSITLIHFPAVEVAYERADPAKSKSFAKIFIRMDRRQTVAAWRKWHSQIATFTRGATEAILEAAHLRPGHARSRSRQRRRRSRALDCRGSCSSGRVTATDLGPGMISLAEELARNEASPHSNSAKPMRSRFLSQPIVRCPHLPLRHHVFFPISQSAPRMLPSAEARRARRVCRLGQERSNPSSPPRQASF